MYLLTTALLAVFLLVLRCAGCLLLVYVVQLCRGSALLRDHLPQLQATFTGLLGDSNELTQVKDRTNGPNSSNSLKSGQQTRAHHGNAYGAAYAGNSGDRQQS